jgi:nucleoside-diphosphate-sugar epimerase
MMKIGLTGSKGFIAGHYRRLMEHDGHDVYGCDLPVCNLLDQDMMGQFVAGNDLVVHMAAVADVNEAIVQQDKVFDVNIRGTYNLAKTCVAQGIPLLFISTCCVYGNIHDHTALEDITSPQACEPYAVSKVCGEQILKGMPGLRWAALRIGTIYGPGQREALFTHICLQKTLDGEVIEIHGTGEQTRQLLYIDDLMRGLRAATVRFSEIEGMAVNIAGREKVSANACAATAQQVLGLETTTRNVPQRYGQTFKENINIDRAWRRLGWHPQVRFADGMTRTVQRDPRYRRDWL